MVIEYSKFVAELSKRSIANFDYIKKKAEIDELYEVTQLINTMYCTIVVPEEIFGVKHNNNQKTEFSTREKKLKNYHEEYQAVMAIIDKLKTNQRINYRTIDEYIQDSPVCAFINSLRNSLCHDGIGFLPVQKEVDWELKNVVTDVIFETKSWNDNISFIAVIDIATLEELIRSISALYCKVEERKRDSNWRQYLKFYDRLKDHVDEYLPNYE